MVGQFGSAQMGVGLLDVPRHRVRFVESFEALIAAEFAGDVNAICWPRQLPGDFNEVLAKLAAGDGITTIEDVDLLGLALSPAGQLARTALLADQELLRRHGLAPNLDCIHGYPRDLTDAPVATDVFSFHVDRTPIPADTYLCTYAGACSEGLSNEAAERRVDIADTRAALLAHYGGRDDGGFDAYLRDNSFDLHYRPLPGGRPYAFGLHNLWRIAIAYPGSPVLPCIHRAPLTLPGAAPRLLLIS